MPVMRERDTAVRTSRDRAAIDALDKRRIATAVQQQNALLTPVHRFHDCMVKRLSDHAAIINAALGHRRVVDRGSTQVHYIDSGQPSTAHPIRQREQRVLAR